jgi:hypothetical protein
VGSRVCRCVQAAGQTLLANGIAKLEEFAHPENYIRARPTPPAGLETVDLVG